jgi:S-adenosyl methyltransferase
MSGPATTGKPTSAGMYDYFLGGTAHTPVDRAAAEKIVEVMPEIPDGASANRGFLQRAVTWMATQWRIRQFIDIGSGLPTQRNTHDVVADVTPDGRVVYVDIDPVVVARGREILLGTDHTTVIQGDVRDPGAILAHPETRRLIDPSEPVGLLLVAVLHFVPDSDDPWALVRRYLSEMAPGSCLALSHSAVGDQVGELVVEVNAEIYRDTATPWTDRTKAEIERFFTGLELVTPYEGAKPGVVFIGLWGADDPEQADSEGSRLGYAGVARKR